MAMTLRLEENDIKQLDILKDKLQISTLNKTIIRLIHGYVPMEEDLRKTKSELAKLKEEYSELVQLINLKYTTEKKINNILYQSN